MSDGGPKPKLFEELKRRNVFRVAAMYAVVGWLVVEIASTVLPTFHAPEWILQVLTFLVILGFPIALVLAWAFELTPDGLKREEEVDRSQSLAGRTGRGLDIAILEIYEVTVEIWPGQVVLPAGYTIALRVEGQDFVRPSPGITGWIRDFIMDDILDLNVQAGSGFFLHNHPEDRPKDVFSGRNTLHTGKQHPACLLVPVIPARSS